MSVFVCQSPETGDEHCQDTYVRPPHSAPSLPVSLNHCKPLPPLSPSPPHQLSPLLSFKSFPSLPRLLFLPSVALLLLFFFFLLLLTFLLCFIWITSFFHPLLRPFICFLWFVCVCVNVRHDGGQGFTH